MASNVAARVGTEHCYPRSGTGLGGNAALYNSTPSFTLNTEVNRAKLTAYVSCPFVVLILMVIAFLA